MSLPSLLNRYARLVLSRIRSTAHKKSVRATTAASVALVVVLYAGVYRAPADFPAQTSITIERGMTLEDAVALLHTQHIIRSPFLLRSAVILLGGEHSIYAGEYYFEKPTGAFEIARRIARGDLGITPVTVRIPEGAPAEKVAALLEAKLDNFDTDRFIALAKDSEGYLFPDTYYFLPKATPEEVIGVMKQAFITKVSAIAPEIEDFGVPLNDVVTMASLLEREAHDLETKQKIAGVLWNRLDIGMPLQIDAVFLYLIGKGSASLTLDDLSIDSPYNTYRYAGLPPTPISNPGLDSIRAAVTPVQSDYLYYLADKNGVTHFSRTFEEHKQKKTLFLN